MQSFTSKEDFFLPSPTINTKILHSDRYTQEFFENSVTIRYIMERKFWPKLVVTLRYVPQIYKWNSFRYVLEDIVTSYVTWNVERVFEHHWISIWKHIIEVELKKETWILLSTFSVASEPELNMGWSRACAK